MGITIPGRLPTDIRLWKNEQRDAAVEYRRRALKAILDEAGPELDLARVKSVDGVTMAEFERLNGELDELLDSYARPHPGHPVPGGRHKVGRDQVALTKGQSFADFAKTRGWYREDEERLSLGRYIKGFLTGEWAGADREREAFTKAVSGATNVIPTPLSSDIIDLARNRARVFEAGATTVPMQSATLKIARQTGDPSSVWHAKGTADITDATVTLDAITLTAKTLATRVKMASEDLNDAENLDTIVQNAIAEALALELDRVATQGSGASNQPTGLRNTVGLNATTFGGANGGTPANYDFLADAIYDVLDRNLEVTGIIDAVRTERTLSKLKDTTNQPLTAPDVVRDVPRYPTKQVPVNFTVGTSTDTSELYVGDWRELLIGMRREIAIQFLDERFKPDSPEVEFLAWLRTDIQVARINAFQLVKGIRP